MLKSLFHHSEQPLYFVGGCFERPDGGVVPFKLESHSSKSEENLYKM